MIQVKRSGIADLPLHGGRVPPWLASRMATLGTAIAESVIYHYGRVAFLSRLSDPFWFQAFGTVMGMNWHSSGITTSVMGALNAASIRAQTNSASTSVAGAASSHVGLPTNSAASPIARVWTPTRSCAPAG
jgi:hypothetical protein